VSEDPSRRTLSRRSTPSRRMRLAKARTSRRDCRADRGGGRLGTRLSMRLAASRVRSKRWSGRTDLHGPSSTRRTTRLSRRWPGTAIVGAVRVCRGVERLGVLELVVRGELRSHRQGGSRYARIRLRSARVHRELGMTLRRRRSRRRSGEPSLVGRCRDCWTSCVRAK
jgi:hypothetical protein